MTFQFLKRLGVGALYGAGFALGAVVVLFTVMGGIGSFVVPTMAPSAAVERAGTNGLNDQLVFASKPATITGFGTLAVAGSVENKGSAIAGYVNVYADFFEADGSILYQCMQQFSNGLAAGAKEYFVIECHGMNKDLAPKYASHKLHARRMR
jgi:hypothetical protein